MKDSEAPTGKILNKPQHNGGLNCHHASPCPFPLRNLPGSFLKDQLLVLKTLLILSGVLALTGIIGLVTENSVGQRGEEEAFSVASLGSRLRKSVSSIYEIDMAYLHNGPGSLFASVKKSLKESSNSTSQGLHMAQPLVVSSNVIDVSAIGNSHPHFAPLVADRYPSFNLVNRKLIQVIRKRGRKNIDPENLAHRIITESRKANFDPLFVAAVIKSESAFDRFAVSGAGARGLMQILPSTGCFIAGLEGFQSVMKHKLTDPDYNVQLGIAYLKYLEQMYKGNRVLVLTAYNWGPGRVEDAIKGRRKIPAEVMSYALKILRDHQEWVNELMMAA